MIKVIAIAGIDGRIGVLVLTQPQIINIFFTSAAVTTPLITYLSYKLKFLRRSLISQFFIRGRRGMMPPNLLPPAE